MKYLKLFLVFLLVSCATTAPKRTAKKPDVPVITIKYDDITVIVKYRYSGNYWLFIKGVEVMNDKGESKKCMINDPHRDVGYGGRVYESGVFAPAFPVEFKKWLGNDPKARVICDYPQEFKAVIQEY